MEIKKTEKADLSNKTGLLYSIGFVLSLVLVISGFEYKTYDDRGLVASGNFDELIDEMLDIPPTEQPPPPPPKIQQPLVIEVPDEEEIEEEIEIEFDVEINEEEIVENMELPVVEEEVAEEVFSVVEDPAEPYGGYPAFYKYVSENMKYPLQARKMMIEGKVFIEFIVDKDGSLTNVSILKGIGAGCDEEALRVVKSHPNWKPPRQRGRPVKQKIVVPINFVLSR